MKNELKKLIEIYKKRAEEFKDNTQQQAIFFGVIADLENILKD